MREGEDPTSKAPTHAANVKARDAAWSRLKEVIR
jgi:hypothetical protein